MNKYEIEIKISIPTILFAIAMTVLIFLICSSCTLNKAQLDHDIDLINEVEQEVQKPIAEPVNVQKN